MADNRRDDHEPGDTVAILATRYPATIGAALRMHRPVIDAIRRVAAKEARDQQAGERPR